ncbi:methionyl-tRNA formyltransferase [Salinisphaera sp. LB1]|uniref:methionyl-tRNA formyltransferase n=1 Tax=Salinisphaera sp. LB1 TaxID=2183911 RepID=UPI000D707970|nr:methionyl-tRNA formyltransferase [Salinisphaera sp. LB1]AWN14739.1 Methionyl-tRNA formyltransferase [Salinisphaera sp. LB1]
MRIVFAGTPEFALPTLEAIAASGHELVGVFTQPDRPAGRGRRLKPSPVKARALELGLPVFQPEKLKNNTEAFDRLAELAPDVMVVVAYGLILPKAVLDLPTWGCLNVHASLLPRWRGAAPIARAIEAGDAETGVTIMQMDVGLDTGDMLAVRRTPLDETATAGDLHDVLADQGSAALVDALDALPDGLTPVAQDDERATYAAMLDKAEAAIDWTQPAVRIARLVRAFSPWPVAHAELEGDRVRFWQAVSRDETTPAAPGTVIAAGRDGIDIATADGVLRVTELQLPGKRRMSAADAANGRAWVGVRFG